MELSVLFDPAEKPLDTIDPTGGFCGIFRTIGCVGDSLSSGEFQIPNEEGGWHYCDLYEYSWGQFMARAIGSKVYNFSRGGMRADRYINSYAEENDFWNPEKACQAYILALGVNELWNDSQDVGTMNDVKERWQDNNTKTFAGNYAAIIQRLKEIQPDAKFFLMTMFRDHNTDPTRLAVGDAHAALLYEMAAHFDNTYVLDMRQYAPVYDEAFREKFFLYGHMNPMGYQFTAQLVMSYIDYIIRHNMADFAHVGLIGNKLPHL